MSIIMELGEAYTNLRYAREIDRQALAELMLRCFDEIERLQSALLNVYRTEEMIGHTDRPHMIIVRKALGME